MIKPKFITSGHILVVSLTCIVVLGFLLMLSARVATLGGYSNTLLWLMLLFGCSAVASVPFVTASIRRGR